MDNNQEIEYESECDDELSVNQDTCKDNVDASDVAKVLALLKTNELTAQLLIDGNKCFNLSVDDESLICGSSVNKKKYGKSKEGVENHFFETIEQYGNAESKKLHTRSPPSPGMLLNVNFKQYYVVQGTNKNILFLANAC
jgi:hypothetical protein